MYNLGSARSKFPLGRAAMYQGPGAKGCSSSLKGIVQAECPTFRVPKCLYVLCGNSYVKLIISDAFFTVSVFGIS